MIFQPIRQPIERTESAQASPVSPRPRARPYRDYVAQQRALMASNDNKPLAGEGTPLLRQMMIWFACAAVLGLIMFTLGVMFITKAMREKDSITIMLCIMGIACGVLIVVGVGVLAKLLITRKTNTCQGRGNQQNLPQAACFHTCSVIYTPSQDPLPHVCDPPPAYDVVAARIRSHRDGLDDVSTGDESDSGEKCPPVMILPPDYDEAAKPLPPYQDAILS